MHRLRIKDLITRGVLWFILMTAMGCVSNKKVVYMQDKTQDKPHKIDRNGSVVSDNSLFLLCSDDVILIRVEYTPIAELGIVGQTQQNTVLAKSHPYENAYTINSEGQINIPNLGYIEVAGMSIEQAQKLIEDRANSVYKTPVVNIHLLNFEVNILGEVNAPGKYVFTENKVTLFDALAMAHGVAPFGDKRSVKVIRNRNDSTCIYHVDLTDLESLKDEHIYLRPSDTIIIKPLGSKKFAGDNSRWLVIGFSAIISFIAVFFR